jgi:hypothetical protein
VAPLRLGGLRGKQSTPSVWLGGTGEFSAVGKRKWQGERTSGTARGSSPKRACGQGMIFIGKVKAFYIRQIIVIVIISWDCLAL